MKKVLFLLPFLLLSACSIFPKRSSSEPQEDFNNHEYGVFLSIEGKDKNKIKDYKTVVIDAQYFTKSDISYLKNNGQTVYSYLNIGSIEDFRPYYDDYVDITFDEYENWEEERWVDVSNKRWQDFILNNLSKELLTKGIDGFFIDNVDVYYYSLARQDIFDGLVIILTGLKDMDTYLSINGGDTFVTRYLDETGSVDDIMDAVNQETVFSKIDWDNEKLTSNNEEETKYFKEYIESVDEQDKDVYLLEYTTDPKVVKKIKDYCSLKGFEYYISPSIELIV